jgi:archaellum component FlaG (FlaF/FlaG flagellin family)
MDFKNTNILSNIVIVILTILVIFTFIHKLKDQSKNDILYKSGTLAEELAMNVEVLQNRVNITYRSTGSSQVITQRVYVPSEGKVTVTQLKPGVEVSVLTKKRSLTHTQFEVPGTSGTIVDIQDAGFTFKPGMGIIYDFTDTKLLGSFDIKFLYYKRVSLLTFTTLEDGGLEASYHIDQFFPEKMSPYNIEFTTSYGIDYKDLSRKRFGVGLRVNF